MAISDLNEPTIVKAPCIPCREPPTACVQTCWSIFRRWLKYFKSERLFGATVQACVLHSISAAVPAMTVPRAAEPSEVQHCPGSRSRHCFLTGSWLSKGSITMGGAGKRLCIRGLRVIVCFDCHLDQRQERTILIGRGGRWKYALRLPEEVLASCSEAWTDLERGENLLSFFFFKLVGQR